MSEPIRVLHFADIHVGMENYGKIDPKTGISSRVMDFLRRLTEVIEYAEAYDADLAVFAGDAFKSRQPNPTYQREFARRIKRLSLQCPVVLLLGNHDIPSMVQKASSVEIFHTLEVDGIIVGRTPKLHLIETKRGPVQVATMPYPVKQRLLANVSTRGMTLEQVDEMLRDEVSRVIRGLADEVDPDLPAILTGHFTVQGARLGSERGVMLGRDVSVLRSTLSEPIWDYVAMGHIHYHQDMNEGFQPPIIYSGSLERIDFGEEGDPKGFCWIDLVRSDTTWEFVPVSSRDFLTIRVDVRGVEDPMATVVRAIHREQIAGAVVRMIIKATPEDEPKLRQRDIRDELKDAAFIASVQHDIEYPVRDRRLGQNVEGLPPMELLDIYLVDKNVEEERAEILKTYAQQIIDEADNS